MNKIDMMYDMMVDQRNEVNNIQDRLTNIEKEIRDFKEFKGRLAGVCVTISAIIGTIPHLFKYLHL